MNKLDQQKAGLQDDHDLRDGPKAEQQAQRRFEAANATNRTVQPRQGEGDNPPGSDVTGGAKSHGGM